MICFSLDNIFQTISHCYREANSPSNRLANYGGDSYAGQVFNGFSDLPQFVKGDIKMDKLEIGRASCRERV